MRDYILAGIIYICFASIICLALYITQSLHVLWFLLLTPSINIEKDDKKH